MAKRKRDMQLNFRVSSEELAVIEQKMSQLGTSNREAYLRKMALDGYVVKLELPELKELVSLMRRSSNNLNQLTRKVHETGRVYDADLKDMSQRQELYSAVPSSSTSRAFDPSGLAASVRNTACPASVRQIDVVRVSPGNTGDVNRAATALTFVASPPPSSATSAFTTSASSSSRRSSPRSTPSSGRRPSCVTRRCRSA